MSVNTIEFDKRKQHSCECSPTRVKSIENDPSIQITYKGFGREALRENKNLDLDEY